jgi:Thymidylate synthase
VATLIKISDMYEYRTVLDRVMAGARSSPRGKLTRDIGPTIISLANPRVGFVGGLGRGISPRVAAVEALQLICGFHDPDLMVWASRNFEVFQEAPGVPFYGAYGDRIGRQLYSVVDKLCQDPETRQAVVTLWDPDRDNDTGHLDYPCTVGFGLRVNHGRLDMWTSMRSNDAWLGLPYDVFQFTQLQLTVANVLGVGVGTYTHFAASLHIYEPQWDLVDTIRYGSQATRVYQPQGLGGLDQDPTPVGSARLDYVWNLGRLMHKYPYVLDTAKPAKELTESEHWYFYNVQGYGTRAYEKANLG